MGYYNSGLYSHNEFKERSVLKLAPDAFIAFNNSYGQKYAVPRVSGGKQSFESRSMEYKGGITSLRTSTSVSAPGAGTCEVTIVCPQYESLQESYYIEQADGTKIPYFMPLMEVKVYMKGRFLNKDNSPIYYPVFWGWLSDMTESTSGGVTTFSLSCKDMLAWWENQSVAVTEGAINKELGGQALSPTATLFRYMNPWDIIVALFNEKGFDSFVYPAYVRAGQLPNSVPNGYRNEGDTPGAFSLMRENIMSYWESRFPFRKVLSNARKREESESTLEMFGLAGKLDFSDSNVWAETDPLSVTTNGGKDDEDFSQPLQEGEGVMLLRIDKNKGGSLTPNFDVLGQVMPFGFGSNATTNKDAEAVTESKLGIAAKVTSDIGFEFFLDPNGNFVFKPPFYNLDTSGSKLYRIQASDIVSINESFSSSMVVNALDITGMMVNHSTNTAPPSASHWDFPSIAKYGLRYKSLNLAYGNTTDQLRAFAVSEMAKANAMSTTADLEIPLRPEIRPGYPIYIDHLDCYYYVAGISHSITFGSTATTSLVLNAKRHKVRDAAGQTMRAYIYQTVESVSASEVNKDSITDQTREALINHYGRSRLPAGEVERKDAASRELTQRDIYYKEYGYFQGMDRGLYVPVMSRAYYQGEVSEGSNATAASGKESGRSLMELVQFTKDSTPYTDVSGYLHIGAYPYGANLELSEDFELVDKTKTRLGIKDTARVIEADAPVADNTVASTLGIGATPSSASTKPDQASTAATKKANPDGQRTPEQVQKKESDAAKKSKEPASNAVTITQIASGDKGRSYTSTEANWHSVGGVDEIPAYSTYEKRMDYSKIGSTKAVSNGLHGGLFKGKAEAESRRLADIVKSLQPSGKK